MFLKEDSDIQKLYLKKQIVVMTPLALSPKDRPEATEHRIIIIKVIPYTFFLPSLSPSHPKKS